jgi:hypothetical protein
MKTSERIIIAMSNKLHGARLAELEKQWQTTLDTLIQLAEQRKACGYVLWSDPDAIREIIARSSGQIEEHKPNTGSLNEQGTSR